MKNYPLNRFPQVEWEDGVDDYEVVKPNTYINLEENVLLEKDERKYPT